MREYQRHMLRPGTVLQNQYRIEETLGEGGFGITYRGMDLRGQRIVAVKEFFIREQNYRNCEVSDEVQLLRDEDRDYFLQEKQRFLQESTTLSKFQTERQIVDVLDYFEANGTAYMVMDYVEGNTLKAWVDKNGSLDARQLFAKLLPFLAALQNVHKCGIIHRDITPENIMLMEDGSLKLLDFGAARTYKADLEKTYSVIVKRGYAPPEQYIQDSVQGPWTDVYALCATMYYCLTGSAPQDALTRILFDELVIQPELWNGLGKVLRKGLSLAYEERYGSIEEMERDISRILVKGEMEEQQRKKRRRIWRAGIAAAVFSLLLAGAYILWRDPYLRMFKLKGIETETALFVPDAELTEQQSGEMETELDRRTALFVGKEPYYIEEMQEGSFCVTFPSDVLEGREADELLERYVLGSDNFYIEGDRIDLDIFKENIRRASVVEKLPEQLRGQAEKPEEGTDTHALEVVFDDETAEAIEEACLDSEEVMFWWGDDVPLEYPLIPGGDGHTFYLICSDAGGYFQNLLAYDLTHGALEEGMSVVCGIKADWEDPEKETYAGKNQCRDGDLTGATFCAEYASLVELSTGEAEDVCRYMKAKLDALEIPYVFGASGAEGQKIAVMIEEKDLCMEIMELLGYADHSLKVEDFWGNCIVEDIKDIELIEDKEGLSMEVEEDETDLSEGIEDALAKNLQKDNTWYLKLGGRRLAFCDPSADIVDGRLIFRNMCLYGEPGITEDNSAILRMAAAMVNKKEIPDAFMDEYDRENFCFFDEDGRLYLPSDLQEHTLQLGRVYLEEQRTAAREWLPGILLEQEVRASTMNVLYVSVPGAWSETFVFDFLDQVQRIYEACKLEEGEYDQIVFYWRDELQEEGERVHLSFTRDAQKRKTVCDGYFCGERMKPYEEMLKKVPQENSFYRERYSQPWSIGEDALL